MTIHPLCPECNAELHWGSSVLKKGYLTYRCETEGCKYSCPIHAHSKNTFVLLPKTARKPVKPHYWQIGGRNADTRGL